MSLIQAIYDLCNRLVLLRRSACACGVECLLLDPLYLLITQIKCLEWPNSGQNQQ